MAGQIRTTGVTGMLVEGDTAYNVTFVATPDGFRVRDNATEVIIAAYEPTFARFFTQRSLVRAFKRLGIAAPTGEQLLRIRLDSKIMGTLKAVGLKVYNQETFVQKMDPKRAPAILAGITEYVTERYAAA